MSANPSKASVTVRIAGEEHTIRASAEPEYTKECARFVDRRISEVRKRSGLIETHRAAILAALSIADEYFQMKEDLLRLRDQIQAQTDALAEEIEKTLD